MFKKRECKNCGKKTNEKHEFCPHCGDSLESKHSREDWGMLGRNDEIPQFNEIRLPKGMNMLFNSLMKSFNKQFEELNKEMLREQQNPAKENNSNNIKKSGISISISTSGNMPPEIKVNSFGDKPRQEQIKKPIQNKLSQEKLKQIAKLPKEEPITNIRRLSNKVIYEIDIPGVESINDISIVKLENSIEIKAVAKEKVYTKLISINLPITNYNLSKGKLILELGAN